MNNKHENTCQLLTVSSITCTFHSLVTNQTIKQSIKQQQQQNRRKTTMDKWIYVSRKENSTTFNKNEVVYFEALLMYISELDSSFSRFC